MLVKYKATPPKVWEAGLPYCEVTTFPYKEEDPRGTL
jgi:hypothetical protein